MPAELLIRPAVPADVDVLHRFVVELAEVEGFPGAVTARPEDLGRALFDDEVVEAVVGEVEGEPVGCALYYPTYSTITGRRGIHLEDLYVGHGHRGAGHGLALLRHLAGQAAELGGRLEWWVLRTNDGALRFYGRLGARGLDEIEVMRLDGERLTAVAEGAGESVVPTTLAE